MAPKFHSSYQAAAKKDIFLLAGVTAHTKLQ